MPLPFNRKAKAFPEILSQQICFSSCWPEWCHTAVRENGKVSLNGCPSSRWRFSATRSILVQLPKIFWKGWHPSSFSDKELKCWNTAINLYIKNVIEFISSMFPSYCDWTHQFLELKWRNPRSLVKLQVIPETATLLNNLSISFSYFSILVISWFIHSFNIYLLRIYYVPGIVTDATIQWGTRYIHFFFYEVLF